MIKNGQGINTEVYRAREKQATTRTVGEKTYEIKDHLGNVRTTFSDMKQPIDPTDLSLGYGLDFQTISNYYPFGMHMPGMAWSEGSGYRYGFQGQEKDNEIYGEGNMTTAEFWQYDTRLGRRWNRDPVVLHSESGYATFRNNPASMSDEDGNEPQRETDNSESITNQLSIGANIGSGGVEFNLNLSTEITSGNFTASYGLGITYDSDFYTTGKGGFSMRNSLMLGFDDGQSGMSVGTNFWTGAGEIAEFDQQTGIVKFKDGEVSFSYENDGSGFEKLGLGDGGDSYRTAGANFSIGEYSLQMDLFTGLRNEASYRAENMMPGGRVGISEGYGLFGEYYNNGFVVEQGEKYRFGGLSLNWGGKQVGLNSEWIRHAFQNKVAHNFFTVQRQFPMLSNDWKPILNMHQPGSQNEFTNFGE
jgi:hypothetical protein